MTNSPFTPGIAAARLDANTLQENFGDLHPPLDGHEALVAADRCYFCYDAPCVTACPTDIDIPLFIRQIATGTPEAAAKTIFDQNILGGMCARVCPTETLCEEACVREKAEGKPVLIGQLQRYATDTLMEKGVHPYEAGYIDEPPQIAVVGAGPAGLACAHRLATYGYDVALFDKNLKPGGLNEYGIAAYKSVDDFAQSEVDWVLKVGGIRLVTEQIVGRDVSLNQLSIDYEAVFLGMGLGGVNSLQTPGVDLIGVRDAVDFIAELRQDATRDSVAVGRDVVVIGGGMTAIDAAVQAKLLGAPNVTILYRRGRDDMPASRYEQDLAASKGVRFIFNASPAEFLGDGEVMAVKVAHTGAAAETLPDDEKTFTIPADQVLKAIGQRLMGPVDGLKMDGGKIAVTGPGRTSFSKVWAGGDCATGGDDLTVTAVAEGRDAAEDIHATFQAAADAFDDVLRGAET